LILNDFSLFFHNFQTLFVSSFELFNFSVFLLDLFLEVLNRLLELFLFFFEMLFFLVLVMQRLFQFRNFILQRSLLTQQFFELAL
jgi:hypothetical protein